MSGIAGWFGGQRNAGEAAPILAVMVKALGRAEGPSAYHALPGNGFGLMARTGRQMAAAATDGGVSVVIQGRPWWDDPELAVAAESGGFAQSLVTAYGRYGTQLLQRLKGTFAVAIYDAQKSFGFAAIDRSGIATLVVGQARDGAVVFAATTDGVRAYPEIEARLSPQAVFNYLYTYTVPSPTAIYQGQFKLLPGEMILWQGAEWSRKFYWTMPYAVRRGASAGDLMAELRQQLADSFARTVDHTPVADVGAFLSGGLDSSTVAGLMAKHYGEGRTFTITFNEPAFDEGPYARIAARHFATLHQEYTPTPVDVLDLMPRLADVYDEPYGNTSAIAAYACARMAQEAGVKVMLAGDGGDEIFAGNERYAQMQRIERYGRVPSVLRRYLLDPLLAPAFLENLPLVGKARRLSRRYAIPMPERMFSYGFTGHGDLAAILAPDLAAAVDLAEPLAILREVYGRPVGADLLQRMMHLDLKTALADNDLRKNTRMCALAGVEVRFPLMDDDLVAFAATIPSRMLLPGTQLRRFFKDAMADFLPSEIITKEKHGFGLPFAQWIKGDPALRGAVSDLLASVAKRRFFNPAFLQAVRAAPANPHATPYDGFAWDIAILELWLEKHIDL